MQGEETDGIGAKFRICLGSYPAQGKYGKRLGKKIYGQKDSETQSSCPSIFLPIRASLQGEEMAGIGEKFKYLLRKRPRPRAIWKRLGKRPGKKIYGQEDSKTKSLCPLIFLPIRASMQGEEMAGIGAKSR
jgi:hypothetical protein